jgi:hypothetical protein
LRLEAGRLLEGEGLGVDRVGLPLQTIERLGQQGRAVLACFRFGDAGAGGAVEQVVAEAIGTGAGDGVGPCRGVRPLRLFGVSGGRLSRTPGIADVEGVFETLLVGAHPLGDDLSGRCLSGLRGCYGGRSLDC